MSKVAFFTMDTESYYDTSCIKKRYLPEDSDFNCAIDVKRYVDFLQENSIKSTLFLSVSYIKDCNEYLLEAIKNGHEIGLHCLEHESYKKWSVEDFEKMIVESIEIIKKELGVTPVGFRFPCYEYRLELIDVLKKYGFIYDSSVLKPNKEFKKEQDIIFYRNGLYEFVPSSKIILGKRVVYSGGGYCRVLPEWFMLWMVKKHIRKSDSFLIYIHPFEIHEGYLPMPKGLNFFQKMFINRHRDRYLSFIQKAIDYMKENGYEFSNMKEYSLKHQLDK